MKTTFKQTVKEIAIHLFCAIIVFSLTLLIASTLIH